LFVWGSIQKGALLCEQVELDEAYNLLNEARRTRVHYFGKDHELVADTDQWLGNVMREDGNLSEALEYFKIALRIKKLRLGENHEDVANAMHNMAIVLDDLHKFNLSLGFYKEVRQLKRGTNEI
jgi:tetratricopeptide (TPR) repeat protein